ncbi:MAG: tetratricopeptide repeat protein, partial [Thiovulaceae bacterium]|nr:tetratricopeptide repeat protein [Sulfurimonadaceae bacterium]
VDTEAGLLDFMELNKAKQAYEKGDYKESSKLYEKYAQEHQNGQSYFNSANSYYKQKDYKKALELYKKATFNDKLQRAKNFANMGNAYVKSKTPEALNKAVEAYESSLKIIEDKEVRENLEAVKKELEKQKKNQQNKDSKNDKNKDKKEDKKKDNKSEDSDKKNSDEKSDDKDQKDSSKSKESKDKQQQQQDSKSKEEEQKDQKQNKDNNESKQEQQKLQNLSEDKNETKEQKSKNKQEKTTQMKQMSDAELEKWINQLQTKQKTYLYQLNKQTKRQDENEKPW